MKKIKLYELFLCLSKWDKNHFEEFVKSPYFNKREDMILLFDFLNHASPKILNSNNYRLAYKSVYPHKKYDQKDAYLLFSYLYKLLEKFMALQAFEKDKALLKFYSAKYYRSLKMDKPFQRKLEESREILEKSNLKNSDYLRRQYDLEYEYYDYLLSSKRTRENNLEKVGIAFDVYYISEKLRLYCFQLSHQTVYEKKYTVGMSKEVIRYVEDHPEFLNYPLIAIYFNYYQALFYKKSKAHFIEFRQKIETYKSHFTHREIRDIYLAAINVCIQRINKEGDEGQIYLEEIFELYKNGFEQNILFENDQLSSHTFTNTLSVTIKLKALDWLERFIHDYKSKLNPQIREAVVNYAMGVLRYEQKNYKVSMQLLAQVDIDDSLIMLNTKNIQIRIYYELEEFESLSFLLESTRLYVERNKKIGYHGPLYLEIIKFTKKLISLKPYDTKKRKALIKKAEKIELQSFRNWVLKQLTSAV